MTSEHAFIGVGLYAVPEAARITGVSSARIRRWLRGYKYDVAGEQHISPPVWTPDLPLVGESLALSFRDLVEVRFVDYFLKKGVSWPNLRAAARLASEATGSTHPFSTKKFKTDGDSIFASFKGTSGAHLLDFVRRQFAIPGFIEPYLFKGLEFANFDVIRWFPMEPSKRVVIDPRISFGQPIVLPEAVPTSVLARAFRADDSVDLVAKAYEVSKHSVNAAVKYERLLAA